MPLHVVSHQPATALAPVLPVPQKKMLDVRGFIMKTPMFETDLTIFQELREPNKTRQWNLAQGPRVCNLALHLSVLPRLCSGSPSFQS